MNSQRTMIYKQSFTAVQEYAKNTDLQTFHGSAIIRKETGLTNTVSQQYKNSQRTMIYKQCFTAVQAFVKNNDLQSMLHNSTSYYNSQWTMIYKQCFAAVQ